MSDTKPPAQIPPSQPTSKKSESIPGWLGPIVGPIIAIAISFTKGVQECFTDEIRWYATGGIAFLGFIAGMVVWYMDRCRKQK